MVGSVPGALIRTAFAPAIFEISSLWILSSSAASMTDDEMELLLLLADGAAEQATELLEVRRGIYTLLLEEAWRTAMRSRHYLTTQCLDTPNDSAWMVLYHHGSDLSFLNATSLTR
jgi:hypothetical protein